MEEMTTYQSVYSYDESFADLLRKVDAQKTKMDVYRPLPELTAQSLRDYYRVGLTYSSNALEGNSLTESETKVVLEDGLTIAGKPLREIYETTGHAHAFDHLYALIDKTDIDIEDICMLHKIFYQQIDATQAGIIRTIPVFIQGSQYAVSTPQTILRQLISLLRWLKESENKVHPVELAAELHKRFVFIHPFVDGNGRVSRLLMNLILLRHGYNVAVIPPILRHEYITALETAHLDPIPFFKFIAERVFNSQHEILRLLKGTDNEVDQVQEPSYLKSPIYLPQQNGGLKMADLKNSGGLNTAIDQINAGIRPSTAAVSNLSEGQTCSLKLNKRQWLVYQSILATPGVQIKVLTVRLGIPVDTLDKIVAALVKKQLIERRGSKKTGGYWGL